MTVAAGRGEGERRGLPRRRGHQRLGDERGAGEGERRVEGGILAGREERRRAEILLLEEEQGDEERQQRKGGEQDEGERPGEALRPYYRVAEVEGGEVAILQRLLAQVQVAQGDAGQGDAAVGVVRLLRRSQRQRRVAPSGG